MDSKLNDAKSGHLFTVELLFNDSSNGLALEKLLNLLNLAEDVIDYKVVSGIELGQLIDANRPKADGDKPGKSAAKLGQAKPKPLGASANAMPSGASAIGGLTKSIVEQFEQLKKQNALIRLTIVKGKGLKFNLPCRIVHYDTSEQTVTVYHVDDKKVYTFKLNEVDDFSVA